MTGFYSLTPGRLCAHCGAELSRYRRTYCNNACREAEPLGFVSNPKGRRERRSVVTPEFRTALCGLWTDGLSMSAIGARLGITKNSAAGFVHRWNLEPRGTPISRKPAAHNSATKPARGARVAPPVPPSPAFVSAPEPLPPAAAIPGVPQPVAFLPVRTCQYPRGQRPHWDWCGAPTIAGGPYCEKCRSICWQTLPRFRALETAA